MKKICKNNLDEMKEQELLHIEKNGCWLAFWGLFIAQAVQFAMSSTKGGEPVLRELAGEWIIFMVLALYLLTACLRKGIWDRRLKHNMTTNLVVSLIAGAVSGIIFAIRSYYDYAKPAGAAATGIVMFLAIFFCCMVGLSVTSLIYKKRCEKMEADENLLDRREESYEDAG